MLKTKIKQLGLALLVAFQAVTPAMAGTLNVRAYATDTVAGYASLLKSSALAPGKEVVFVVEKPDTAVVRVQAQADLDGIARADLYGHQTKTAGTYKVALYYTGTTDYSPQSTFKVYPDQVSRTQSSISVTDPMVEADGVTQTYVTVTLYDAYRNPIKDHQVELLSSRQHDKITPISYGVTDKDGRTSFKVTSKYDGVSVFTAMDVSANTVLEDREEVVFYAPSKSDGIGGNFLSTNALQANIIQDAQAQEVLPGPVDHFEIQDVPSEAKVNTDLNLTIVARDSNDNVAKNYTGTILISTPDDENAVLPSNGEYTFKEADQGSFTFNLALRFSTVGSQFIQVLDKDDWKISGEFELDVVPEQAITTPDVSASLAIKAPVDGAVFGSNLVIVTGQGDPNINLKVFDDDVKIGDTETDSDGFFSYQANNLAPGSHSFYVMSEDGKVSKTVTINVDTLPPVLNYIDISPQGVVIPGENLNIVVNSEPNLDEVKIRLQGVERELMPETGQAGSYSTSIAAPGTAGSYPLDVILVDSLANRSELRSQATILVEEEAPLLPPTVENPEGVPGDGEVVLTWDPVTDHSSPIAFYEVAYGTDMENPDQTVETADDATAIKISDLENDTQYFFTIRAVDSKGEKSEEGSTMIAVTPVAPEPEEEETPPEEEEQLTPEELFGSAPETGQPPTSLPPASFYNNPLGGAAASSTATLTWQPFPGVQAVYYKVYFGLKSKQYDDYVITPDNRTTFAVSDLINGIPYYFAVAALDFSGNEISPLSAEFTITPQGGGYFALPENQVVPGRPVYESPLANFQLAKVPTQDATGSEAWWLVGISVLMAGGLYLKKRKLVRR